VDGLAAVCHGKTRPGAAAATNAAGSVVVPLGRDGTSTAPSRGPDLGGALEGGALEGGRLEGGALEGGALEGGVLGAGPPGSVRPGSTALPSPLALGGETSTDADPRIGPTVDGVESRGGVACGLVPAGDGLRPGPGSERSDFVPGSEELGSGPVLGEVRFGRLSVRELRSTPDGLLGGAVPVRWASGSLCGSVPAGDLPGLPRGGAPVGEALVLGDSVPKGDHGLRPAAGTDVRGLPLAEGPTPAGEVPLGLPVLDDEGVPAAAGPDPATAGLTP
jgi:hypothetical protein